MNVSCYFAYCNKHMIQFDETFGKIAPCGHLLCLSCLNRRGGRCVCGDFVDRFRPITFWDFHLYFTTQWDRLTDISNDLELGTSNWPENYRERTLDLSRIIRADVNRIRVLFEEYAVYLMNTLKARPEHEVIAPGNSEKIAKANALLVAIDRWVPEFIRKVQSSKYTEILHPYVAELRDILNSDSINI